MRGVRDLGRGPVPPAARRLDPAPVPASRAAWVIPLAWTGVVLLAVFVAFVAWSRAAASRQRATRDATLTP